MSNEKIIEAITTIAIAKSNAWAKKHGYIGEDAKVSAKGKKMLAYLKKAPMPYEMKEACREIYAILAEEALPSGPESTNVYERGVICVPIDSTGGHDYPVNVPLCFSVENRGIRMNGTQGNTLPSQSEHFRNATDDEIATFVKNMIEGNSSAFAAVYPF